MTRYLFLLLLTGCAFLDLKPVKSPSKSPPPKTLSIKPRVEKSAPESIKPPVAGKTPAETTP